MTTSPPGPKSSASAPSRTPEQARLRPIDIADLPLARRTLRVGPQLVEIEASVDQSALLVATEGRDILPFGLLLWEAAIALGETIAERDLTGLDVLELGCGVGLPGIVAARAGARVLMTDIDMLALEIAARNVRANGVDSRVTFDAPNWRTWAPVNRFDMILGADIVYDWEDHAAIVRLITTALRPGGVALITDPRRSETLHFLELCQQAGLELRTATRRISDIWQPAEDVDVDILELRQP